MQLLLGIVVLNIIRPIFINCFTFQNDIDESKSKNTMYPTTENLNFKMLLFLLGSENYLYEWMSINRPEQIFEPSKKTIPNRNLEILSTFKNYTLTDEKDQIIPLDSRMKVALKKWVIKQATCNVEYVWKKLDRLHWPSWIRHGICMNKDSCSWPPGMNCRSESEKTLRLLHWECKSDPFGNAWKMLRQKVRQIRERRRIRRFQRLQQNKRFKRRRRRRNQNVNSDRYKRKIQMKQVRYEFKTSKFKNNFFCHWKPKEYRVIKTCICSCQ